MRLRTIAKPNPKPQVSTINLSSLVCKSKVNIINSKTTNIFSITRSLRGSLNLNIKRSFATETTTGTSLFQQALKELEKNEAETTQLSAVHQVQPGKLGPKQFLVSQNEQTGVRRRIRAPDEAWATCHKIQGSVKKVNAVAALIRGLSYQHALNQLKVCPKKVLASKLHAIVNSARYNAENIHNLDPSRLIVAEVIVGRDFIRRKSMPKGRKRVGAYDRYFSRVTIILRELSEKDPRILNHRQKAEIKKEAFVEKQRMLKEARVANAHKVLKIKGPFLGASTRAVPPPPPPPSE